MSAHAGQAARRDDLPVAAARSPEHLHGSGDLPSVLEAAPMFRRTVAGYDRYQVDTYVRWAEDELATAARELERLLDRHLRTTAELDDARRLLSHSTGGREFLRVSRRIGSMLAAAADEAENIRAEAENHRAVARAQAEVIAADARRVLADAEAEALRTVEAATAETEALAAGARQVVADAEQHRREARFAAEAMLEVARVIERRAVEDADVVRWRAEDEIRAARNRARDEIVQMLGTAREERRRADAESAATRDRLDRDAASRRAALLAEVDLLEHRRAALLAQLDVLARSVARATVPEPRAPLPRFGERPGWRPRFLRVS